MFLTFDSQDGNRLQLEKIGPTFSSETRPSLSKNEQNLTMLCFPRSTLQGKDELILDSTNTIDLVLVVYFLPDRGAQTARGSR